MGEKGYGGSGGETEMGGMIEEAGVKLALEEGMNPYVASVLLMIVLKEQE